ncbi:MAG TPA: methionine aminotransferase [Flavisolibacter sp.]|nr:methionine aminotransferase [Flavisolibacter sp.]
MQPQIQSKLPNVGTTIFTVMSVLAAENKAINLGQGMPDYPMNEELVAMVCQAMKDGYNQYVHMNGYMPLRETIAEKVELLYQTKINPDTQITVTPGGTYALYTALTTVLQPGDEVIVFEPGYDSYIPSIEVNGAKAVRIPLTFPDYKIDWALTKSRITERTRGIMINSPHNPTGSVLSREDIEQLRAITKDTQIIIVSDEVYEHLMFDGKPHQSILRYPDLMERSFVSFSFGKVYHCTGWKLGYSISSPSLMKEFRKIHQFNAFCCDTPKQVALASFLKQKDHYLQLGNFFQKKRDFFRNLMSQTRFEPLPSYGSYFQVYSYKNISDETEKDIAIRLTKEIGVATIPVAAFYTAETNNQVLRFCFAKTESALELAAERLMKL